MPPVAYITDMCTGVTAYVLMFKVAPLEQCCKQSAPIFIHHPPPLPQLCCKGGVSCVCLCPAHPSPRAAEGQLSYLLAASNMSRQIPVQCVNAYLIPLRVCYRSVTGLFQVSYGYVTGPLQVSYRSGSSPSCCFNLSSPWLFTRVETSPELASA